MRPSNRSPRRQTRFFKLLANTPRLLSLVWQAAPIWLSMTVGLTLLASLIPVVWLYLNKLIIDWITTAINTEQIEWKILIVLIGLRFIVASSRDALNELRPYVSQALSDRFGLYANQKLLEQALKLDLAHFESSQFQEALSRAQQSGSTYPVRALGNLTTILGQGINLLGVFALLVSFNPAIILLLLLTSLPTLRVGVSFSNKKFALTRKRTLNSRVAAYFQRLITHQDFAKEVRLFNLGSYLIQEWQQINTLYNQEVRQLSFHRSRARFLVSLLPSIGFYGAYIWVIYQATNGTITLGDLIMYSGAFSQAQSLLNGITENLATTYESNLYVSQYFDFLKFKPQIISPLKPVSFPNPIQKEIRLNHVKFAYPESQHLVLNDLNLTIYPGESIAVVGVNGAGKTTLVKLLTRLYDASSGEIYIDNVPIQAFNLTELRHNIAVLFQDFAKYKLSIQENIGFGNIETLSDQTRIDKAASEAGAAAFIQALEAGYQAKLGNLFPGGQELSGGQWQKIGLARAFMSQAQILILDEPTASIDAIAEFELFKQFRQLTQGRTTIFISHRFSSVRLANRIVVLDQGQVAEIGSHDQLMANQGLYAQMFRLQAEGYQYKTPATVAKHAEELS